MSILLAIYSHEHDIERRQIMRSDMLFSLELSLFLDYRFVICSDQWKESLITREQDYFNDIFTMKKNNCGFFDFLKSYNDAQNYRWILKSDSNTFINIKNLEFLLKLQNGYFGIKRNLETPLYPIRGLYGLSSDIIQWIITSNLTYSDITNSISGENANNYRIYVYSPIRGTIIHKNRFNTTRNIIAIHGIKTNMEFAKTASYFSNSSRSHETLYKLI